MVIRTCLTFLSLYFGFQFFFESIVTAWFYINSNVKDPNENFKLKKTLIDMFCASNVTEKNRANVERMVKSVKDAKQKKELQDIIKAQKSAQG